MKTPDPTGNPRIVEVCFPAWGRPRHRSDGAPHPDRADKYYVRAATKKRVLEILAENGCRCSLRDLRNFGLMWGNRADAVPSSGDAPEGLWLTRDHHSKEVVEVWVPKPI